jgi:hypothetical protein
LSASLSYGQSPIVDPAKELIHMANEITDPLPAEVLTKLKAIEQPMRELLPQLMALPN